MFKMDVAGNGMLIEKRNLNQALDMNAQHYTFDKFRYMCILSGCDYLPSLPGIGLGKASKVFKISRQTDMNLVRPDPELYMFEFITFVSFFVDNLDPVFVLDKYL